MRWLLRVPLRLKIASVGGVVLLLMLIALGISSINMARYVNLDEDRDRMLVITQQTDSLLLSLIDMETGVRGYVITANREFLESYSSGAASYPVALQRLKQLTEHVPEQKDRVERVANLIAGWQADVLEAEIYQVAAGLDARATVASKAGKVTMDRIRAELNDLNAAEASELAELTRTAEQARRQGLVQTTVVSAAALLLGLFLSHLLARSLTRPLDRLVQSADAIAQGDIGVQIPVYSQDEVGKLAATFNRMSMELLAHQEENAAQNEELQAQQEELIAQNDQLVAQQERLGEALDQVAEDRNRLEKLNHFHGMALECPDLDSLARFVLGEMIETGGAQVGALALVAPDGSMQVKAAVGLTEAALQATSSAGFPAEALRTGGPCLVTYPNTALLRPIYHTALPVEREIYLPIVLGGDVNAVVALGRTGPDPFTDLEQTWLSLLASQAAATLSNRLAYDRLNRTYSDLRAILESTSEGICMVDRTGRIMLVNDRFWSLVETVPRPGSRLLDLCSELQPRVKEPEALAQFLQQALTDAAFFGNHLVDLVTPAPKVLQCYTAPVFGEDGAPLGRLFVQRDVTRETEVDRMKTEFISTVSHELRTPLTAIRGYVDLILDGDVGEISEEQREFLGLVSGSTVRLADLINDLLDVEKIEHGGMSMRREAVNLAPLLEQVVKTFRVTAADAGLGLSLTVPDSLPQVFGDADRLTQVMTNLLSNAIKYTKAGEVRLTAGVQGSDLVMAVADTGIGIAPEHLPNLFGKFYRVDNQYTREVGGTGLGLAITKAIVERHSGRVEVESTVGQGSTFTVRLPILAMQ